MGQFLSQPILTKESESGGDDFLKFGLSSMQGWRSQMEDSHSTILDLNKVIDYKKYLELEDKKINETIKNELSEDGNSEDNNKIDDNDLENLEPILKEKVSFFAVFDGHGGSKVALFAGEHLPKILKEQADLINEGKYDKALQNAFLACDTAILQDPLMKNDRSGCAATSILLTKNKMICANSGDSRIVLSTNGYAKPLSYDHKPNNEGEKARIVAAGGFVDVGRVNGNLALSRCIGDFNFKTSPNLPPEEQVVTAFPDVIEHEINYKDDEFLIIACDGIWDCLSSQEAVELVRRGIFDRLPLQDICEAVMDVCVAPNSMGSGIGCDNMSIIVVAILNGKSLDQWYDDIIAKKETPVAKSMKEVRIGIYNTDAPPATEEQTNNQGSTNSAEGGSLISKELSELLTGSVATYQDGTYYIDTSSSSSLLATFGIIPRGEEELEGEAAEESSTKVEQIEDTTTSTTSENIEEDEKDK